MVKVKKVRIFWLAVFFLTIIAGVAAPPARAATDLSDISGHWAYAEIDYLYDQGIIYGDLQRTFRPDDSINRAEFITMLNRAFEYNDTTSIQFTDVNAGDWYYWEVAKAVKADYISGLADGSMRPGSAVTRQEAAAIMARILELDTSSSGSLNFADEAAIPAWSRDFIAAMVREGYMKAFGDGSFRPLAAISRAEAAVLIYNSMIPKVPVTGVNLDKSSATLYEGGSLTLTATIDPPHASNKKVIWYSNNPNVASVSSSGQVMAEAAGSCTITVTTLDGSLQDTCRINVKEFIPVKGVNLDQSSVTIGIGRTVTLYGTFEPKDATNQDVLWSSSNNSVATVSSSGQATGLRPGTAVITVKTEDGGYSDTCRVNVTDAGYIDLSLDTLTMYLDKTQPRTLYAFIFEDESDIRGVIWESDDEEVAAVEFAPLSLQATITAVDTGTCTISVEVVTQEGEYHDSCTVWILD